MKKQAAIISGAPHLGSPLLPKPKGDLAPSLCLTLSLGRSRASELRSQNALSDCSSLCPPPCVVSGGGLQRSPPFPLPPCPAGPLPCTPSALSPPSPSCPLFQVWPLRALSSLFREAGGGPVGAPTRLSGQLCPREPLLPKISGTSCPLSQEARQARGQVWSRLSFPAPAALGRYSAVSQ